MKPFIMQYLSDSETMFGQSIGTVTLTYIGRRILERHIVLRRQVVKKVWLNVSYMFHRSLDQYAAAELPKQEMATRGN